MERDKFIIIVIIVVGFNFLATKFLGWKGYFMQIYTNNPMRAERHANPMFQFSSVKTHRDPRPGKKVCFSEPNL